MPQPFAPDWAMLAGWDVFAKKGCGQCHSIRGGGGTQGPDLARLQGTAGFFDIGAAMWNHLPRMGAKMREARIERPRLTPLELANLVAFLHTATYFDERGNAKTGERLFSAKGCGQCHAVGGKGGSVGPALDALRRVNSPVLMAAAMWNHGPKMAETMKSKGIERPTFQGNELGDLIAYVVAAGRDTGGESAQVIPGTPERGEKLFREKHCATCHAVGGKGGHVGPDLARGHRMSLTQFAARMWNHGPAMWTKMNERSIEVPGLTGQDMADLVAYLYVSHYFDPAGNASRGRTVLETKGCLNCHSVNGKGGKAAGDFAKSDLVGSPASLVAGMWNHSLFMEWAAEKKAVAWPVLSGAQLDDISAYLGSLARSRPRKAQ
jgi:mono/diheme cytochrome c family protein